MTTHPYHETPSPEPAAPALRLTLRLNELAPALGVSRRAIERERAAGRFPKPDLIIGRMPLWRPETILTWIAGGGQS
jgi:predicted DNA-binding transcriptional regulator AlpA